MNARLNNARLSVFQFLLVFEFYTITHLQFEDHSKIKFGIKQLHSAYGWAFPLNYFKGRDVYYEKKEMIVLGKHR